MIYYALLAILFLSFSGAGIYYIGYRLGYAKAVEDCAQVTLRRYLQLQNLNGETRTPRAVFTRTNGSRL